MFLTPAPALQTASETDKIAFAPSWKTTTIIGQVNRGEVSNLALISILSAHQHWGLCDKMIELCIHRYLSISK
jgi:hypothetical protein